MTHRTMALILLFLMMNFGCGSMATRSNGYVLTGDQLRALHSGKTVLSKSAIKGHRLITYYNPDGTLAQDRNGRVLTGSWWIDQEGKHCAKINRVSTEQRCRIVTLENGTYKRYLIKRRGGRKLVQTYETIRPGDTHNLMSSSAKAMPEITPQEETTPQKDDIPTAIEAGNAPSEPGQAPTYVASAANPLPAATQETAASVSHPETVDRSATSKPIEVSKAPPLAASQNHKGEETNLITIASLSVKLIGSETGHPVPGVAIVLCRNDTNRNCVLIAKNNGISNDDGVVELSDVIIGNYSVFYDLSVQATEYWQSSDGTEICLHLEGLHPMAQKARNKLFSTFAGGGSIKMNAPGTLSFGFSGRNVSIDGGDASITSVKHRWTLDIYDGKPQQIVVNEGAQDIQTIKIWRK